MLLRVQKCNRLHKRLHITPPLPPAINTCINSSQLLFSWSNYALDYLRNVPARRRRRAPLRRSSPARRESTSTAVVPGRDSLHDIGLARGIEGQEEEDDEEEGSIQEGEEEEEGGGSMETEDEDEEIEEEVIG